VNSKFKLLSIQHEIHMQDIVTMRNKLEKLGHPQTVPAVFRPTIASEVERQAPSDEFFEYGRRALESQKARIEKKLAEYPEDPFDLVRKVEVIDRLDVAGRGHVLVVVNDGREICGGMTVEEGNRRWRVKSVEGGVSQISVGLVVSPICTCSCEESEEMTRHAQFCAVAEVE
jgi:hypothetical protein